MSTNEILREEDKKARDIIVNEIDKNIFVKAGAGSGKTTMLVNRMVAMVEAGIDVSEICAITFTNAAAGEFYERFQKKLADRSNPLTKWEDKGQGGQLPEPTEETRKRCEEALRKIDLCFMGTIDSFCGRILKEHPNEAGISSDVKIVPGSDLKEIIGLEYNKICEGVYGNDLKKLADNYKAVHSKPKDVFVQLIFGLIEKRNSELQFIEQRIIDMDSRCIKEREEAIKLVETLKAHSSAIRESNKDSKKAWDQIDETLTALKSNWNDNFVRIDTLLKNVEKIQINSAPLDENKDLNEFYEKKGNNKIAAKKSTTEAFIGKIKRELKEVKYRISMTFFNECIPVIADACRDKGIISFFDALYYLRDMLKKDAEKEGKLIGYICEKCKYFLIDEFQDTNPLQAEVFFYLAAKEPMAKWYECKPRKGSLFIVGDANQSIYRFVNADVKSFIRIEELFKKNDDTVLMLSRNFRSKKDLCEFYNQVFNNQLTVGKGDANKEIAELYEFQGIPVPDEREEEFQGVYKYDAKNGTKKKDNPEEIDYVKITKIIKTLVNNDDYQIIGEDGKSLRPIRYSDCMIITKVKKQIKTITSYLNEKGIATREVGDVPFKKSKALFEISKIYAAIADPFDKMALYGALIGELIGISDEEYYKYAKGEEIALVAEAKEKIIELGKRALKKSPASLFVLIMEEYNVFEKIDSDNMEALYYALELMRSAEKAGEITSVKDGMTFLNKLFRGDIAKERNLELSSDNNCVYIANLHKVKGMEAPVVILANDEGTDLGKVSSRTEKSFEESKIFVFKEMKNNRVVLETSEYDKEKIAEIKDAAEEVVRNIYVAATRARNVLIICKGYSKVEKNMEKNSNGLWNSLLDNVDVPDFFEEFDIADDKDPEETYIDPSELYEKAQTESALNGRNAEDSTYESETPSGLKVASKRSEEHEETYRFGDIVKAKDLGNMVHRLMEIIVSARGVVDESAIVEEAIGEYSAIEEGEDKDKLRSVLLDVIEKIKNGGYEQSNSVPQDILKVLMNADEVHCEVPFCYIDRSGEKNVIWNGIMDVVYREGDEWHIVDYKTNADPSDLDSKYQEQLKAYIKAFKEITGNDADAKTYHVGL